MGLSKQSIFAVLELSLKLGYWGRLRFEDTWEVCSNFKTILRVGNLGSLAVGTQECRAGGVLRFQLRNREVWS